ncbi:MAG: magnesium chelatase ATPase subunit D, partial [Pseudomonadota bacterium]
MSEADDGFKGWASAVGVAALLCVDPLGLGGVRLRARPGYVRDAWLRTVRELLPPTTSWQRVPANIRDDHLLGGLDLTATLRAGRAVAQRGVLAQADEGILEIAMAERLDGAIAAKICATVDSGVVTLEREGLASRPPARFTMIALDEGELELGEAPPASLCDRLGFVVDLHNISWRDVSEGWFEAQRIAHARGLAPKVKITDAQYDAVAAAAIALGVWSLRPSLFALRAARAAAALEQRTVLSDDDLSLAVQLVLAPRAT